MPLYILCTMALLFVAVYVPVHHSKIKMKQHGMKSQDCCIKCYMLNLTNYVWLQALSSGMYERESTAKHGTARHSTARHGTARHSTAAYAGHDITRHRTALRRAVGLGN